MARVSGILLVFVLSLPAMAQPECPDIVALRSLYGVRQMLMEPYANEYTIGSWIDGQMDDMRDPLPGGGYRWVKFVRPSGDGPVEKREHLVSSDQTRDELEEFEAAADHPFAVRVVVPRKRTTFRNNKEVYVGDVNIRYWVDGKEKVLNKSINQWMAPDTSRSFDLGAIADRAEVSAQAGARAADVKAALVEIHFRQALAQDDPENPNYETIAALKRVRNAITPVALDLEIARLERRIFPNLDVIPFTTIAAQLREAETLMKSQTVEEQEKGRKVLAEAVKALPR